MRLYQYKAINSNWFVIAVAGGLPHRSGQNTVMNEMDTWCLETYDSNTRTLCYVGEGALEKDTWGFSSSDYYFKNESDAFHFVLRWSGEE
jgi:hypothetical protein